MMVLVLLVAWFVAYWGGMAAVIWMDARRQRAAMVASGNVDFIDRSPKGYMLLGLLFGPLPLIVYFGSSRRSAGGWLFGLGIAAAWTLLFGALFQVIDAYAATTI